MVDQNTNVNINPGNSEQALKAIAKGFLKLAEAQGSVIKAGGVLDKNIQQLTGSMVTLDAEGNRIRQNFIISAKNAGLYARGIITLQEAITKKTRSVKINTAELKKNQKQLTKGQKSATQGAITKQVGSISGSPSEPFATQAEDAGIQRLTNQLRDLAANSNITAAQINKVFNKVATGGVGDFRGALGKVQDIAIKLRTNIRNLGKTGEAAFNKTTEAAKEELKALVESRNELFRKIAAESRLNRILKARNRRRSATPQKFAATQGEQLNLQSAENNLRKLAATTKITGQQIDRVFAEVASGQINNYQGELAEVQTAIFKIIKAEKALGATAEKEHERAAKAAKKQAQAEEEAKTATQKLVASLKSLGKVVGISLLIGSVFQLQQALVDGTQAAIEFSKRIAEIRTIDTAAVSTEKWTNRLRELSDAFGIPIINQAEAAYQTLSNQVATGANATKFLETANRLAITAVTDNATAVNTLTSVINAFRLPVEQADDISAKLFKTVELGRVRLDEMAESLGRIGVPAARIGVRFEELLAAITVTTRQGVKFNEASTFLRGIIQKLVKPTEELSKFLNELGFSSSEAAISTLGLSGLLAELDKRSRGSSTEIAKLFNRIRASTGALIFAGQGVQEFNRDLSKIDSTGVEEFAKTTGIITRGVGKQFEDELNKIANFFRVDVGQAAIKAIVEFGKEIGGLSKRFIEISKVVGKNVFRALESLSIILEAIAKLIKLVTSNSLVLTGVLTVLSVKLIAVTKAFIAAKIAAVGFAAAASATVIGALVVALGAAALAVQQLRERQREATSSAIEFNKALEEQVSKVSEARAAVDAQLQRDILAGFNESQQAARKFFQAETAEIVAAQKIRLRSAEELAENSKSVNRSIIKGLKRVTTEFSNEAKKLEGQADKTADNIRKSFQEASKKLFSFDISIAADQTQLKLIESQISGLQAQQQAAAAAGDKATFERVSKQIISLQGQRLSTIKSINQAQRKADTSVFKARADLTRAQATNDAKAVQKAQDALTDAKKAQRDVGFISEQRLSLEQQIAKVRRDLSRTSRGTAEEKALRQELKGLRDLQVSINTEVSKENAFRKEIEESFKREAKLRKALAAELRKEAEAARAEETTRRLQVEKLVALEKKRTGFDPSKLQNLKGADLAQAAADIEKVFSDIAGLQTELNRPAQERLALEQEIAKIREIANAQEVKAGLDLQQEAIKKEKENLQLQLKNIQQVAREQQEADSSRLNELEGRLTKFADSFEALGGSLSGRASQTQFVAGDGFSGGAKESKDLVDALRGLAERLKVARDTGDTAGLQQAASVLFREINERNQRASQETGRGSEGVILQNPDIAKFSGQLDIIRANLGGEAQLIVEALADARRRFASGDLVAGADVTALEKLQSKRAALEEKGILDSNTFLTDIVRTEQDLAKSLKALRNQFAAQLKVIKERTEAEAEAGGVSASAAEQVDALKRRLQQFDADIQSAINIQNFLKGGQGIKPTTPSGGQSPDATKALDGIKKGFDDGGKTAGDTMSEKIVRAGGEAGTAFEVARQKQAKVAADEAKALEDTTSELSKQRKQQEAIAKATEGLTGRARKIAETDARKELGLAGVGGAAKRKSIAEEKAAQRERNAEFFRQRQAKQLEKSGGTFDLGGQSPIDAIRQKVVDEQKAVQAKLATAAPEDQAALKKQLENLNRTLNQTALTPLPGSKQPLQQAQLIPGAPRLPDFDQIPDVDFTAIVNFEGDIMLDKEKFGRVVTKTFEAQKTRLERLNRKGNK